MFAQVPIWAWQAGGAVAGFLVSIAANILTDPLRQWSLGHWVSWRQRGTRRSARRVALAEAYLVDPMRPTRDMLAAIHSSLAGIAIMVMLIFLISLLTAFFDLPLVSVSGCLGVGLCIGVLLRNAAAITDSMAAATEPAVRIASAAEYYNHFNTEPDDLAFVWALTRARRELGLPISRVDQPPFPNHRP